MPENEFFWIWRKLVTTQTVARCTLPAGLRVPVPYAFMPEVFIYPGAGDTMKVDGTDEPVGVVRLK